MKHNIQTTTPQTMTASEIENLALHILALKGNYDFTGTNVTITPPTDMDPDMAGIIVKCAQKTGGTVNINGATEISDDAWNIMKEYAYGVGVISIANKFGLDVPSLAKLCAQYPSILSVLYRGTHAMLFDNDAYFNVGNVTQTEKDEYNAEYKTLSTRSSVYESVFGGRNSGSKYGAIPHGSGYYYYVIGASAAQNNGAGYSIDTDISLHIESGLIKTKKNNVDWFEFTGSESTFSLTVPLYIGAFNDGGSLSAFPKGRMKFKYLERKVDNVLVNLYVPCSDGRLIDLCNGKVYDNIGAGGDIVTL